MTLAKEARFVILVAGGVFGGLILYTLLSSVLVSWKGRQQEVREAEIQRQLELDRIARYEQDAIDEKKREEETKNARIAEKIWRDIIEQVRKDDTEQPIEEKITKQPDYQKRLAEVGREKCRSEELMALERVVWSMGCNGPRKLDHLISYESWLRNGPMVLLTGGSEHEATAASVWRRVSGEDSFGSGEGRQDAVGVSEPF